MACNISASVANLTTNSIKSPRVLDLKLVHILSTLPANLVEMCRVESHRYGGPISIWVDSPFKHYVRNASYENKIAIVMSALARATDDAANVRYGTDAWVNCHAFRFS